MDILVDLTGHTYNNRINILAYRPSLIVVSYLGFPNPSGCDTVNYFMTDRYTSTVEGYNRGYHEKLLYLPYHYQANNMPIALPLCTEDVVSLGGAVGSDGVHTVDLEECRRRIALTPLSAARDVTVSGSDATKGLPPHYLSSESVRTSSGNTSAGDQSHNSPFDSRPLLCSFNAMKKLEPVAVTAWANVLNRIPEALLVLLNASSLSLRNLQLELMLRGVDPHRIRIADSVIEMGGGSSGGCTLLHHLMLVCVWLLLLELIGYSCLGSDTCTAPPPARY